MPTLYLEVTIHQELILALCKVNGMLKGGDSEKYDVCNVAELRWSAHVLKHIKRKKFVVHIYITCKNLQLFLDDEQRSSRAP